MSDLIYIILYLFVMLFPLIVFVLFIIGLLRLLFKAGSALGRCGKK